MQIKWFPSGLREIEREGERERKGERELVLTFSLIMDWRLVHFYFFLKYDAF